MTAGDTVDGFLTEIYANAHGPRNEGREHSQPAFKVAHLAAGGLFFSAEAYAEGLKELEGVCVIEPGPFEGVAAGVDGKAGGASEVGRGEIAGGEEGGFEADAGKIRLFEVALPKSGLFDEAAGEGCFSKIKTGKGAGDQFGTFEDQVDAEVVDGAEIDAGKLALVKPDVIKGGSGNVCHHQGRRRKGAVFKGGVF